jgi:hypothetical protein
MVPELPAGLCHSNVSSVLQTLIRSSAMPTIELEVPHDLTPDQALSRIQNLVTDIRSKYGSQVTNAEEHWNGHHGSFSFTVMGFDVSGIISVKDNVVQMEGKIPLAASFFKGQISSIIRQETEKVLQKEA